jgi:hypothetical protein
MGNRRDYFFRQIVTEGELDQGYLDLEDADRNFAIEHGLAQLLDISTTLPDVTDPVFGGIVDGLDATTSGTLVATVTKGVAYDQLGRRQPVAANATVDLTATGETSINTGGTPTGGAATAPNPGETRWVTLMLVFDRLLSDPRVDGNGATVFFQRDESFRFRVRMGASIFGPNPITNAPPVEANTVLLGDFQRDAGSVITEDYRRRGDWLRTKFGGGAPTTLNEVGALDFIRGTPREAIIRLRDRIDAVGGASTPLATYLAHISQALPMDRHAAKNIDFAASDSLSATARWVDGSNLAARLGGGLDSDGLQSVIAEIITLLGGGAAGTTGASKLSILGVAGAPSFTAPPVSIVSGALQVALGTIVDAINSRFPRAGNDLINGYASIGASAAHPALTPAEMLRDTGFPTAGTPARALLARWRYWNGPPGAYLRIYANDTSGRVEITTNAAWESGPDLWRADNGLFGQSKFNLEGVAFAIFRAPTVGSGVTFADGAFVAKFTFDLPSDHLLGPSSLAGAVRLFRYLEPTGNPGLPGAPPQTSVLDPGGTNRDMAVNQTKAWGVIGTGGAPDRQLYDGYNIAGLTYVLFGDTRIVVDMHQALDYTKYRVVWSLELNPSIAGRPDAHPEIAPVSGSQFEIRFYNAAGVQQDPSSFTNKITVIVLGRQGGADTGTAP